MRLGWILFGVACSGFFNGPVALGETTAAAGEGRSDTPATDPALAAFERGNILYKEHKFVEASNAFREAYRLRPSWRLLYNLGQSEAAAKRLGPALEAFEAYLAEGGDEVDTSRAEAVRKEILRLRDLVGFVDVKAPAGADIVVDDVIRGQSPLPGVMPVTAGVVHSVSASKDGVSSEVRKVKVTGGQTRVVDLHEVSQAAVVDETKSADDPLSPAADNHPAAHPSPVSPVDGGPLRALGWTLTGAGAALLLGSVGTGTVALVLDGDIGNNCPEGVCDASWSDELQTRDRLAVSTNVLLGVGSAALVAGVVVLLVTRMGKNERRGLSMRTEFAPQSAGAQVIWDF